MNKVNERFCRGSLKLVGRGLSSIVVREVVRRERRTEVGPIP